MSITTLEQFAPDELESGVGLAIQDDDDNYILGIPGIRHKIGKGTLLVSGIGGHREAGESWIDCAQREAIEEIGTDVILKNAPETWYVPHNGDVQKVTIHDKPTPFALYEMIHPVGAPRAGEIYRIVIYKAQLQETPSNLPEDELFGLISCSENMLSEIASGDATIESLLENGAKILIDHAEIKPSAKLVPIGTVSALIAILEKLRG